MPEKSRHGLRTPHCEDLYPMLAVFAGKNTGDGPTDVYYVSSRSRCELCVELFLGRG